MTEMLKANILAHLAYFRRSRILLAFGIVALLLVALMSLPSMFINSGVQKFNQLRELLSTFGDFLVLLSAGISLFLISSHLRNRSLKMVFTKPCPPSLWLFSSYLASVIVVFVLNLAVYLTTMLLSYWWHLPVRAGLAFVCCEAFLGCVCVMAYLFLLATVAHPALAAVCALIFNAGIFYDADFWTRTLIRSGNPSHALRVLEKVFFGLYLALPMFRPFSDKTDKISASLRVLSGEWKYLAFALGYTLALSAFFYFLSLAALQRRRHI